MFLQIVVFILTFSLMEFMAWFTHKYVMHGFLWNLHADHHKKDHDSWFEKNDAFFIFYAIVSITCFYTWSIGSFDLGLAIGLGILAYGIAYFFVHDIFIHQRFKLFRNANNKYAKAVRRAHKMHHKHIGKDKGECFGMLVVPWKYFKN
ncbi:sterol desaturase family protein [Flavobacterium gelidilacus]|jgi:beta-carotene 3-hydroxylase|uniref:sterol desaturase family protein n=1 Tax=Flavobacterium gelidilacus TaxID=206041 RepID=UPI000403EEF9|nr:sterol desaturase family protein [Flavobacterium gelidilacus]|tara:strand:+ start:3115 stop:3558 length:444 start_codon:yes stop_codon:yes gene_type:complete